MLTRSRSKLFFTGGILLLAGFVATLAVKWPFTRARTGAALEEASQSRATLGGYTAVFFPHPGCVIQELKLSRGAAADTPLITARRLTIEASWADLLVFRRRVAHMRAEGLHVYVPPEMPPPPPGIPPNRTNTTIGELIADGAALDIEHRQNREHPLHFDFPELTLDRVSFQTPIGFRTRMLNPEPPGIIRAHGSFGPWRKGSAGLTPLSGAFELSDADLGRYGGISGLLASRGEFRGPLGHIDIRGEADVPNFEVTSGRHPFGLRAAYQAVVNGLNGDVVLNRIDSEFMRTRIAWRGAVAGRPGQKGKTASLDFASTDARIQDLLRPFVSARHPPFNGAIRFRGHVELPPGDERFLKRVQIRGEFGITGGLFTNPARQADLNQLSSRASGEGKQEQEDPAQAVSNLRGSVALQQGSAHFSNLSFAVPGAAARLDGTYDLISERIDLHGTLSTEASLSQDSSGVKSFLLKPFNKLFKKRDAGAVVPVWIGGTYSQPTYGTSLHPVKARGDYPRVGSLK